MVDRNSDLQSLISRAKIFNAHLFRDLPANLYKILVEANLGKRHLNDAEFAQFSVYSGLSCEQLLALRGLVEPCVREARGALVRQHPELFVAGGALATPERAEACWRDCENFFRVVIYAVASARPRFSDQQSIDALNELYGLMGVPTEGLAFALNQLSAISRASFEALYDHSPVAALLQDSFDNLRELLFGGSVKS
jgi:hypothetical protein